EAGRRVVAAGQDHLGGRRLVGEDRQALAVDQADAVVAGVDRQLVDLGAQRVELLGQRHAGRAGRAGGDGSVGRAVGGDAVGAQVAQGGAAGGRAIGADRDRSGGRGALEDEAAVAAELGFDLAVGVGVEGIDQRADGLGRGGGERHGGCAVGDRDLVGGRKADRVERRRGGERGAGDRRGRAGGDAGRGG